ncbi:MAG: ribonuclease III [Arenicella sp.]
MDKIDSLSAIIGYQFDDKSLLQQALTHRSKNKNNYERLEFLGDSILSFVVSGFLYDRFPELGEGRLSRMRASLVCKESLAEIARDIGLGEYLILGEGERKSGGFNRDSILSDAIEGIIGAIYIDSRREAAYSKSIKFIEKFFTTKLQNLEPNSGYKDNKSQLQEFLQKRGHELPEYEVVNTEGEAHQQVFDVKCRIVSFDMDFFASGTNRKEAEQTAASEALDYLVSKKQKS